MWRKEPKQSAEPLDPVDVFNAMDRRRYPLPMLPQHIESIGELPAPLQELMSAAVAVHEHRDPGEAARERLERAKGPAEDALGTLAEASIAPYTQGDSNGATPDQYSLLAMQSLDGVREVRANSHAVIGKMDLLAAIAAATQNLKTGRTSATTEIRT